MFKRGCILFLIRTRLFQTSLAEAFSLPDSVGSKRRPGYPFNEKKSFKFFFHCHNRGRHLRIQLSYYGQRSKKLTQSVSQLLSTRSSRMKHCINIKIIFMAQYQTDILRDNGELWQRRLYISKDLPDERIRPLSAPQTRNTIPLQGKLTVFIYFSCPLIIWDQVDFCSGKNSSLIVAADHTMVWSSKP